jgi:hypothetical protein
LLLLPHSSPATDGEEAGIQLRGEGASRPLACRLHTGSRSAVARSVETAMAHITRISILLILFAAGCGCAEAHSFGVMYTLPIPFWMYAFAVSATLALSFLMIGFFATGQSPERVSRPTEIHGVVPGAVWTILRILSVVLLVLTILTGLFGADNLFTNFSLTFFWIGFVLGFAYLTALVGDLYAFINPWRVLCDIIERLRPMAFKGRVMYPAWLAYYPALALYMGFIWLELFGRTTPRTIGLALVAYTMLNFTAAAIFGAEVWFRYGEFFAVFFRLLGKISPLAYAQSPAPGSEITVRLRRPFIGLIEETADHQSILLFVLFMLSSTAFDGMHETLPWVQVFWRYVYPPLTWAIDQPYSFFVGVYYHWQWAMLWLSPFIYFAIYLLFIWMMTGHERRLRERALLFGFSLIPIAFVYNLTHYFTLLFTDAPRLLPLISDPFGAGWDLFGTARFLHQPMNPPPARFVWHIQVGLILLGHVVSVYLAHQQALRIFPNGRKALWSQFPMLVLMIALTSVGLWILSLPIGAGQVLDPTPTSSASSPAGTAGPVRSLIFNRAT